MPFDVCIGDMDKGQELKGIAMRLLDKLRRDKPAISAAEIKEIQDRVRWMREQIGRRELELADLFVLVKEDERPLLREIGEVKRPDLDRVWPHQVPSTRPESQPTLQFAAAVEGGAIRP